MKQNGIRNVDVAVLGGGPAGAAIALELRNWGYSTVIIERSDYRGARIGETLPPAVCPLLVRLGVWARFLAEKHSPSFGIRSAWGKDELHDNDFIFNPYGAGWHVDRDRFDATLVRSAEERGATIYRDARLSSFDNNSDNWKINLASGNQQHRLSAKFLVDATGRASVVARKQGAKRIKCDRLIGVISFLSLISAHSSVNSSTLIEAVDNGWWYSAVLPNSRLVLAYMTDADLFAKARKEPGNDFLRQLESTKHTRERVSSYVLDSSPHIVAANSSRLDKIAGRNWLAVGDAAMAFDPLSGQGVYKALEMAARAAQTIHEYWSGNPSALRNYGVAVDRDFDRYLRRRQAFYSTEGRFLHSIFWQRRIFNQFGNQHLEPHFGRPAYL